MSHYFSFAKIVQCDRPFHFLRWTYQSSSLRRKVEEKVPMLSQSHCWYNYSEKKFSLKSTPRKLINVSYRKEVCDEETVGTNTIVNNLNYNFYIHKILLWWLVPTSIVICPKFSQKVFADLRNLICCSIIKLYLFNK